MSRFEKVYSVGDIDGAPLNGFADFNGKPYSYERIFNEDKDDWSNEYKLIPINEEILAFVKDNWKYWLWWLQEQNNIPHPVFYKQLREEKSSCEIIHECNNIVVDKYIWIKAETYYQNQRIIEDYLKGIKVQAIAKGEFKVVVDGSWGKEDKRMPKLVRWYEVKIVNH